MERRRNEVGEEREVHDRATALDLEAADGEGREGRDHQGEEPGRDGDHERIPELQPEMAQKVVLLPEHDLEIAQGRVVRPELARECVLLRRDREQHHVVDRQEGPGEDRDADEEELRVGRYGVPVEGALRRRRSGRVMAEDGSGGRAHFDSRFIMK